MKERKHILFLSSWYPSGAQPRLGNYIRQLAELMSENHRISVVSLEKDKARGGQYQEEKINENFSEFKFFYSDSILKIEKIRAHKRALSFVKSQNLKVDILHAHIGLTNWWHFLLFKKALGVPMVYSEHGSYFFPNLLKKTNWVSQIGLKCLLKKADAVTAVSEILADQMKTKCKRTIHVIGNILPKAWEELTTLNRTEREEYCFLHVSTADEVKNIDGILDAISILKRKNIQNFTFTFLCDENLEEIKFLAKTKGVLDDLTFLGPTSHFDMPSIYLQQDCFVLSSFQETFSIVLAEALFFGLHVISTRVGFLATENSAPFDAIEMDNPNDLAQKMERAIELKKHSGMKGRSFVKPFSQEEIIAKYGEIYQKLLFRN